MTRTLILSALAVLASAGCATQNPTDSRTAANTSVNAAHAAPVHCVKDGASFIKRPDKDCLNVPGTSYSQQELQDTGQLDVADALRRLDPRIQ